MKTPPIPELPPRRMIKEGQLPKEKESKYDPDLNEHEKKIIKVLNYVATFDGIITNQREMRYILQKCIEEFIPKKKQYLLDVEEKDYLIKIVKRRR